MKAVPFHEQRAGDADLQNLHCIFPAKTTAISLQIYCDGLAEWPARPVAGLSGRSPSITAALKIVAGR